MSPAEGSGRTQLHLEVHDDPSTIAELVPEWRELASVAARSPFESPGWLVPWFRHYGRDAEPRILAWRTGGRLVAVAPLILSRRRQVATIVELAFWGGTGPTLRGLVDVLAQEDHRESVMGSFATWLRSGDCRWDLLHALRLPAESSTPAQLQTLARANRWRHVGLTGVVRSDTYVLDLTAEAGASPPLGPKARHNLRTEERRFARIGGRYEVVTDPAAAAELRDGLRRLAADRWGEAEIHFRPDRSFAAFIWDAFSAMLASGSMYAHVARDRSGIRACLVTFEMNRRAAAVLIAVSAEEDVRRLSLGKHLFDASIGEAVARGCRTYDFLWVGGYKETFWHARPHRLESLVLGRGARGWTAATYIAARRRVLPRLARLGRR